MGIGIGVGGCLQPQSKAVIPQGHPHWQFIVDVDVVQLVGDMREVRLFGLNAVGHFNGLLEVEVGRVRAASEGVENQNVQALQQFVTTSGEIQGVSDEDLDALWDEADLDDIELDSQALEIARAPLFDDSDEDDPLF